MRYICTSIVATLALVGTSFAATINVPVDHATIQGAVDAAANGDEILVAPGIYTGADTEVVNTFGKAITLRASGTPEETIIDGEGVRLVIRCDSGETPATIIEGFTITGGSAYYGGGIYCDSGSSPTITNCTIESNSADSRGGGIYCDSGSSPTITNCTIESNSADSRGGGIYSNNSSPTITGGTISGNTAYDGGGLYCTGSANGATISGCTITSNTAAWRAGGILCSGGGSSPTITDCTISDNTSIHDSGGGIYYTNNSDAAISGCTISGNQAAQSGGGIYCLGESSPTITDCMIISNVAITSGGGICVEGSFPTLTNTHVCGNVSDQINGIWNDNGENEINEVCPDFVGACCTGNQSWCVAASETDCEYFGGVFMGYGVECADVSCPTSCLGDINVDGEVSTNDLLTVIANWGPCP